VKSWPKAPYSYWPSIVLGCVRVYVDDMREFQAACDPSKIEQRSIEDGIQDVRDWLFPPDPAPQPFAIASMAREEGEHPHAKWLTVTEAARVSGANRGTISKQATAGKLRSNGMDGPERLIDPIDLARWTLERSQRPEPRESNQHVERLLRRPDRH
jgi:hypothetical protein